MQYTDTAGQPAHGDVWSPGPMAATVWVLVAGGGHAVVHVASRREVPEDRWLGRAGSASSNGPTLSAKLWRDALGFDPRAVVRGEVEQPELVADLEPVTDLEVELELEVAPASVTELVFADGTRVDLAEVEMAVAEVATSVPVPVPVPDADPVPEVQPAAAEVAAEPEPEVQPEPVALPLPVGTRVRIRVDLAGRDARVIGADLEDGRVKVRCEDTVGTVWLLDLDQVTELAAEVVDLEPEPEPAARINYRRPAGAYRKLVAEPEVPAERPRIDYRKPVAEPARIDYRKPVAQSCADPRCINGLTRCNGCNGYGVVTAGGRRYRLASGGRNIGDTAVRHAPCAGTGLAVCGCGRLAGDDRKPVATDAP